MAKALFLVLKKALFLELLAVQNLTQIISEAFCTYVVYLVIYYVYTKRIPKTNKLERKKQRNLFQVGFFGGICLPCYELLAELLPGVQPMLDQVILDDYQ